MVIFAFELGCSGSPLIEFKSETVIQVSIASTQKLTPNLMCSCMLLHTVATSMTSSILSILFRGLHPGSRSGRVDPSPPLNGSQALVTLTIRYT